MLSPLRFLGGSVLFIGCWVLVGAAVVATVLLRAIDIFARSWHTFFKE